MGIHVIKMPDIGEGIAEVELVAWNIDVGDSVVEDQPLATLLLRIARDADLGIAARIEVEGAGNADAPAPAVAKTAPLPPVTPAARAAARTAMTAPPATKHAAPAASESTVRPPGDKPIASPAVRRRAWDLGIELRYVSGSGTAGRITHEDLDAYAAQQVALGHAANAGSPARAYASGTGYAEGHDEEAVPVIGLRRKIAQKMQESKRRIPHFTYVEEIDVTELDASRTRLNDTRGAQRGRLSILPFLMRAMVLALRDFPQINARYDDEAAVLTRYGAVHIGIATQTEGGLMVPVVRHAEARDLWSSAAEIARLAEAARSGRATREELSGSTITISSLGALGGVVSTPVINHPEVAIVGVNRMVLRPMMRGGTVVARQMMNLSSSFDHRVIDGLHAAEFIQAVRKLLECPATLFVE
ncbi:MAG: dihydrolipoamide acetyltransferase family protein [Proteobacteria bacterium]|nr:dihydrolipoamide acetyltransferase family protein [Pseudomonadota bacterium]